VLLRFLKTPNMADMYRVKASACYNNFHNDSISG
jgi:hypothetical protein